MSVRRSASSRPALRPRPAALWAAGAVSTSLWVEWLLHVESFLPLDENSGKALLGWMWLVAGIFSYALLVALGEWALRERVRSPWAPVAWGALLTLLTVRWFPEGAMTNTVYVATLLADIAGERRMLPRAAVWPLWLASGVGIAFVYLHVFR